VFAQYTLLSSQREALQMCLADAGIPSAVHYPIPLNEQLAYQHLCCPDCTPFAKQAAQNVMSLPMGPDLSANDQINIIEILRQTKLKINFNIH